MTLLPPSTMAAPAHGIAFVPKELVTIQVGCMSASVYPKVEPTMPIYELAHAYQVIKSALESLPVDMHLILEAIGMQLNCSAIIEGAMFDFRSLFDKAWYDFGNLTIQSFHDSAGKIIQNTTNAGNPSVLLPIVDGALPGCRKGDIRYVRVTCMDDYSRLITVGGPSTLRVAFYIELPQTTRVMTNASGLDYNLTSWLGVADLSFLSKEDVRATIFEPCLRDGPITLGVADFNLAEANVDDKTIRKTINAMILKLGFQQICASVFQQLCPGYSNQPHVAIEHICQTAQGPDGQLVSALVIEYYQRMLNALRPFATEKTYAISVCDWFIQGLDRRLVPCFRRLYPMHSTIHNLDGAYQRQQLPIILAVAQAAEDEVKGVQDIARGLLGQGFYTNVSDNDSTAFNSQAEQTLARYSEGAKPLIRRDAARRKNCFGCGGDHSWMKDKKVVCPCASDPTVAKRAAEMYKKYLERVKELKEQRKRGHVADYKDMNPSDQKCMREAVLAIHGYGSPASSVTSTSTTGSAILGPAVFVIQVPDDNAAVLSAAVPARCILPVPIQTCFPHMVLQLGQVLGCSKCPAIRCVIDTAAAINTGNLHYFAAIAKAFPHTVAAIYSAADHNPIILSGIVQQGGSSVTTDLTVAFQFHMPYLTREGNNTTLLIACGPNLTVNCILGLPFIQATKMVIDTADQVGDLRALDTPPFPLDLQRAMCTAPAVGSIPDNNTAVRYANIIAAVDRVMALHTTKHSLAPDAPKPAGILRAPKRAKTVEFDPSFADDGSIITIGSAIDAQADGVFDEKVLPHLLDLLSCHEEETCRDSAATINNVATSPEIKKLIGDFCGISRSLCKKEDFARAVELFIKKALNNEKPRDLQYIYMQPGGNYCLAKDLLTPPRLHVQRFKEMLRIAALLPAGDIPEPNDLLALNWYYMSYHKSNRKKNRPQQDDAEGGHN
jgi:hypothetical protein